MNEKTNSPTYNLYSTERRYKDYTLMSFYFQLNNKIIKNLLLIMFIIFFCINKKF